MRLEPDDLHHWIARPLIAVVLLVAAAGVAGFALPTIGAPLP